MVTWELRIPVYGYVAWLLIPTILILFSEQLPTQVQEVASIMISASSWLLTLWVNAAIILFISISIGMQEHQHIDYAALSKRAWERSLPLFLLQACVALSVGLGMIAFIIPGILLWVWTAFGAQELVLGQSTVWQALTHSRELVRGRFVAVFGRLIAIEILFGCIVLGLFIGYILLGLQGDAANLLPTLRAWPSWLETGFNLITLPFTPIIITYHLLLYFALKKSYALNTV
ncbi:MAG: hypothetical protein QG626_329 [Patescibacteria group bacterium]|nr:hypothetical protein [Patescibacteria group bacterium]